VLLACVDETDREACFALAAMVVDGNAAHQVGREFDALMDGMGGHGIDPSVELHGHELFQGKGPWHIIPTRLRIDVYAKATSAMERSGAKLFLRRIDKAGQAARYARPQRAHEVALQYLLEDLNDYASRIGEQVLVLADEVHSEARHRTNFRWFKTMGTPGYRQTTLDAVLDTIYFGPSDHSRLLQAANLAAFMYLRRKTVTENDPRAARANDLIWEPLSRITVKDLTSFGPNA
jgi:hypothetical protein